MTATDGRRALAERQRMVLLALVGADESPPGFAADRFRQAQRAVVMKRAAGLANAWPSIARGLGPDYLDRVRDYCRAHPSPPTALPADDGAQFARFLRRTGHLPDDAAVQAVSALVCRSDAALRLAWSRLYDAGGAVLCVGWRSRAYLFAVRLQAGPHFVTARAPRGGAHG